MSVLLIVIVFLLFVFLFILFFKGHYYENPAMSVQKKCHTVLQKINEIEKMALSLEREEVLERFSCKRCIKQNNYPAAMTKARKCIELRKQSQVYLMLCQRVRFFIQQVNIVLDQKEKMRKEPMIHLVNPIAEGVSSMNLGLIELYLESFEKYFSEEMKHHHFHMKEIEVMSYMDAFKNVTDDEINHFLKEMRKEAKEDEKTFMFNKGGGGLSLENHP